jgi:membrane protein YqaA with SNARE-associated domain
MPEQKKRELLKYFSGNVIRGIIAFAIMLVALVALKQLVDEHYESYIKPVADKPLYVFTFFFVSELTTGFIPPEMFMFLYLNSPALKFWKVVTLMTVLSYIGGLCAFYIGRYLGKKGHVERWQKNERYAKFIDYYKRFDGIMLIIAATTPVPFALISMISGALGNTTMHYIKYAFTTRFIRFYLYAYVLWETGNIDFSALFR